MVAGCLQAASGCYELLQVAVGMAKLQGGKPGIYDNLFKIQQEQYDVLPENKKPVADFFVKV